MNEINQKRVDELMRTPMRDWPTALQAHTKYVTRQIGVTCGDILYECTRDYVRAGEPDDPKRMMVEFARGLWIK